MFKVIFPSYSTWVAMVAMTMLIFGLTRCDVEEDKKKCESQILGLATCFLYVSGQSNVPAQDCCGGFNQVADKSPECICLLVKDRNDPSVNLQINATRALGLPALCKSHSNLTINDCPALLHLPPNSPDAKDFQQFANTGNKSNATAPAASGSAAKSGASESSKPTNDGGRKKTSSLASIIIMPLAFVSLYFLYV